MRRYTATALLSCTLSILARAATPDPCTPPNFPGPQFKSATFNVRDFGATHKADFAANGLGQRLFSDKYTSVAAALA